MKRKSFLFLILIVCFYIIIIYLVTFINFINKGSSTIDNQIIAEEMLPESDYDPKRNIIYSKSNTENYQEYIIDRVVYGKFIESEDEYLVALKATGNLSHQGGFYNLLLGVFDLETNKLKSQILHLAADEGDLGFYEGKEGKTLVMFVGKTTYNGWTEYSTQMYESSSEAWLERFPLDISYLNEKKVVMDANSVLIFERIFLDNITGELIPPNKFIFVEELFWDKNSETFIPRTN